MSETKFDTHTEPQAKLWSCFLTADEKTEGSRPNGIVAYIKEFFKYPTF
jgi:hypothetical protein